MKERCKGRLSGLKCNIQQVGNMKCISRKLVLGGLLTIHSVQKESERQGIYLEMSTNTAKG